MVEPLFPVRFPKPQEKEVLMIRLPDGTIVARTREELEKAQKSAGGASS